MWRIVKFIFTGRWYVCNHVWTDYEKYSVFNGGNGKMPTNIDYVLKCTKCGNIKKVRV